MITWAVTTTTKAAMSQGSSRSGFLKLVSAGWRPTRSQKIAQTLTAQATGRNHPVMRSHPTASPPLSRANDGSPACKVKEDLARAATIWLAEFGSIEVRHPNLDPFIGIGSVAYTEAITVTDISNDT